MRLALSARGLAPTSLESMLFRRDCLLPFCGVSSKARENKSLMLSLAKLGVLLAQAGSKSESKSEGEGGRARGVRAFVDEVEAELGTRAIRARNLSAGVSGSA